MIFLSRRRVERNIAYDDVRKRYYVTLEYGKDPENGKQIRQIRTFSKISEARAALRKHEAARDMGQVVQPSSMTLDQWLSHWMDNVVSLNRAVTTVYSYRNMINRHISPALGSIPIQQLTPLRLQEYYAGLIRGKGLSSNTARKHHDLLNLALNAAVRQGIILSNPAQRVDAPKVRRPEIHYYSMEELQRLLRLAEGTRLDILIKLAGLLGLRREEIVGVQRAYIRRKPGHYQRTKNQLLTAYPAYPGYSGRGIDPTEETSGGLQSLSGGCLCGQRLHLYI